MLIPSQSQRLGIIGAVKKEFLYGGTGGGGRSKKKGCKIYLSRLAIFLVVS